MHLRSFRFNLSGYHHYYGHIRLPHQQLDFSVMLGSPTFMRYLRSARNNILLRVSISLLFTVASTDIAGFLKSGGLTDTICVTKPYCCSLQHCTARASQSSFPYSVSGGLQPERQIGLIVTFIQLGIYY